MNTQQTDKLISDEIEFEKNASGYDAVIGFNISGSYTWEGIGRICNLSKKDHPTQSGFMATTSNTIAETRYSFKTRRAASIWLARENKSRLVRKLIKEIDKPKNGAKAPSSVDNTDGEINGFLEIITNVMRDRAHRGENAIDLMNMQTPIILDHHFDGTWLEFVALVEMLVLDGTLQTWDRDGLTMYQYRDDEGRTFDDENPSVAGFIVKTMNQNHEMTYESEVQKTASEAKERADALRKVVENEYVIIERIDRVICYDKQNVWIDGDKIGVTTFKRKKVVRSVGNLEYNIGGGILGTVLFDHRRIKVSWIPAFNRWHALYDQANPPDLDTIHASLGGLMYLNSTEPRLKTPHADTVDPYYPNPTQAGAIAARDTMGLLGLMQWKDPLSETRKHWEKIIDRDYSEMSNEIREIFLPKGEQKWERHSGDIEDRKQTIEDKALTNCSPVLEAGKPSSNILTMKNNIPAR